MPLVKRRQIHRIEALVLIVSPDQDELIVDSNLLVGISDGDVERKVVLEGVVGGEIELGE